MAIFFKSLKLSLGFVLLVFLCLASSNFALGGEFSTAKIKGVDLTNHFNDLKGCAVFYSPNKNLLEIFNKNEATIQRAPQSTFKVASTLMGLEYGIIKDEKSRMRYNGESYFLDEWNKNVTLKEAFQFSCVWYYHQVVYAIPQEKISSFLKKLSYGNEDISQWLGNGSNKKDELNGFWLSSSLKISALEQVQMLYNIFEGKTSINKKYVSILKNIMRQEIHGHEVFAKTGSNMKGESWFVGFSTNKGINDYFAFYVNDSNGGVSGAKAVATSFLKSKE